MWGKDNCSCNVNSSCLFIENNSHHGHLDGLLSSAIKSKIMWKQKGAVLAPCPWPQMKVRASESLDNTTKIDGVLDGMPVNHDSSSWSPHMEQWRGMFLRQWRQADEVILLASWQMAVGVMARRVIMINESKMVIDVWWVWGVEKMAKTKIF
jgi:hypothetical protein